MTTELTISEAEAAHSKFGGSTASRWLNCIGSTALIATVPTPAPSIYARTGLCAHEVAKLCLQKDGHPRDFVGETFHGVEFTDAMVEPVRIYLEAVTHELAQTKDAQLYVEQGFFLELTSARQGESFGTNDALVYHPSTGKLVVFDYKHGYQDVEVTDNDQLKFYSAGAVLSHADWPLSELELVIVQPLGEFADFEDPVKRWKMDPLAILDFQVEADGAVARAKSYMARPAPAFRVAKEDGTFETRPAFKTGKWCKWCPAAAICEARQKEILEAAALDFGDVTQITAADLPDPRQLDPAQLGRILKAGELLNDWLGQVQQYVEALIMSGVQIPGWKAVEKIGRAKWIANDDDVAAYAELMFGVEKDAIMPRKLVTLTEAAQVLKSHGATKEDVDSFKLKFTIKESSGLTIAPETDKRPAVSAVAADFGAVNIPPAS